MEFFEEMVSVVEGATQDPFSVLFTSQTDIDFTVIVETFDTTPPDAIG